METYFQSAYLPHQFIEQTAFFLAFGYHQLTSIDHNTVKTNFLDTYLRMLVDFMYFTAKLFVVNVIIFMNLLLQTNKQLTPSLPCAFPL